MSLRRPTGDKFVWLFQGFKFQDTKSHFESRAAVMDATRGSLDVRGHIFEDTNADRVASKSCNDQLSLRVDKEISHCSTG